MFKKRSRPTGSVQPRQRPADEPKEGEEAEAKSGTLVSDLLALRRLKAEAAPGIEADKLNAGPSKKRKLASETEEQAQTEQAPQPQEGGVAKKNNFTAQQNLIDVNKHMMEYIESEMRKRSGQTEEVKETRKDPRDELYEIDPRFKENTAPLAEGNVTRSTTMLTAIPEVDLGIDVRLKNIEATERAKRLLYEAEQAAAKASGPTKAQIEADTYSRQRFYQPEAREYGQPGKKAIDYERDAAELLKQARKSARERRAMGQDEVLDDAAEAEAQAEVRKKVNELKSTDEQVVARYKNRQRESDGKHNKGIVFNR